MERPVAIANFFIKKAMDEGVEMSLMKLIKLVYIAHGWYLGINGDSLLPESVQAWTYGPVVPSIYHEFKKYGDNKINALEFDIETGTYPMVQNEELKSFLNKIWQVYGKMNGLELSSLTHQRGTPWDIVWNVNKGKNQKSAFIPNNIIMEHYKQKANAR